MRSLIGLTVAASIGAASSATAQSVPPIELRPGEAAVVHFRGDTGLPERVRAEWTAFDVYAARHLSGITPPDAPVVVATPMNSGPDGPKPDPIPPGKVRMRLLSIASQQTLLVVENGLAQPLGYSARMTVNGQTRPTDVCFVLSGLPSYEHWPHPIERIELSNFQLVDSRPGEVPTCK